MRLVVTGATGFIGTALCAALWERGHVLTLFTRGSPRDDEILTEETPPRDDFLAALCQAWEAEAQKASELGMGVVRLRTGIVLGPGGGALAKMAEPFKFYMGGPSPDNAWFRQQRRNSALNSAIRISTRGSKPPSRFNRPKSASSSCNGF